MNPTRWQILLVDDDNDDFLITQALLRTIPGYQIGLEWAPDYAAGLAKLGLNTYDAALVDYDLGAKTGIDFISQMVADGCRAPLILFSERSSDEVDLQARQAGASLYLTKGEATPQLLARSIRYAIERKQAELDLYESRESYHQLFTTMLGGFARHEIILDAAGVPVDYRFLEVNPAFELLTGLKGADIVGKTVKEVLPDTEDSWIKTYGQVAQTGCPIRFENFSSVLGRYYDVAAFSPRHGQFAALFVDITARKQQEEWQTAYQGELERQVQARSQELRSANEILEKIFNNIHIAVAYLDPQFSFIRVNQTYASADGRPADFFTGKNHFDLFPNAENEAIFRKVRDTGEPVAVIARPIAYDHDPERGVTAWDWNLQPILQDDGSVSGLILTLLDVTERFRKRDE